MPVLQQRLQTHIARFGYEPITTPLIEPASLFLTKAGDQIIEHLFSFERGGRQYALRPEFTASAAYQYTHRHHTGVVRWQFVGSVFQDIHETASLGAELIGLAGSSADAEMMGMAATGLQQVGIQGWKLVIGHVGLTRHLLQTFQLDDRTLRFLLNHRSQLKDPSAGKKYVQERLERYLSIQHQVLALDTLESMDSEVLVDLMTGVMSENSGAIGARTREDIARRLIAKRQRAVHHDRIVAALDFLAEWAQIEARPAEAFQLLKRYVSADTVGQAILNEWQATVQLLTAYDLPEENLLIQPDLARSWDYYTGIVFELQSAEGATLVGGGRYDELMRLIGGQQNVPAVGFACDLDALTALVPAVTSDHRTVTITGNSETVIRWAQRLRQQGITVVTDAAVAQIPELIAVDADTLKFDDKTYHVAEMPALLRVLETINS